VAVRSLLARVAKLEQTRQPTSPFVRWFGSLEVWESECQAGIDAGQLDPRDVPVVMLAVRRWHCDGAWR